MSDWTRDSSCLRTQQSIVNIRECRTPGSLPLAIGVDSVLAGHSDWSPPEHDVAEGIMTLAEDKIPEATLLIRLD